MGELSQNDKDKMMQIIDEGLIIEDEMIKLYSNAFMYSDYFSTLPEKIQERLERSLDTLIEETKEHKFMLEKIKSNFQ